MRDRGHAPLQVLEPHELSAILEVLESRRLLEHAHRARFGVQTGIRAGLHPGREGSSVRVPDLDFPRPGRVTVPHQKGGGSRVAAFCDGYARSPTRALLLDYLEAEGRLDGPLWTLSYHAYYMALHRAAKLAGVQRSIGTHPDGSTAWRVHPHALRHTWVAWCRRAGLSWDTITSLGWAAGPGALSTVARYYRFVDERMMTDELETCAAVSV